VYSTAAPKGATKYAKTLLPGPWRPGPQKVAIPASFILPMPRITRIDVGHFERDVIEQGIVRLRVGNRVVDAVAAHEIHKPGAIGQPETEHLHSEARAGFPVPRIEHDVRHLQGPVPIGTQLLRALSFRHETEHVPLGALHQISGAAAGFVEGSHGAEAARLPRRRACGFSRARASSRKK